MFGTITGYVGKLSTSTKGERTTYYAHIAEHNIKNKAVTTWVSVFFDQPTYEAFCAEAAKGDFVRINGILNVKIDGGKVELSLSSRFSKKENSQFLPFAVLFKKGTSGKTDLDALDAELDPSTMSDEELPEIEEMAAKPQTVKDIVKATRQPAVTGSRKQADDNLPY